MNSWLIIFRKEFYRVITDKRLIFTAILLPGIAIYVMYSIMGGAITGEVDDVNEHEIVVYTENMPIEYQNYLESTDRLYTFEDGSSLSTEDVDAMLDDKEMDIYVSFPEDFIETLGHYEDENYVIPEVTILYDSGQKYSSNAYSEISGSLSAFNNGILYERFNSGIVAFNSDVTNFVDESKATGQMFASILPMLIVMFLFSGAMSIGPDSIAGEKERGTIATLLVTPIKRSHIAIGKVTSLTIISLMSAVSSFAGILASLPKLMNMDSDGPSVNIYGISDYFLILVTLLATVFLIVAIVSVVSAYAKTIKEAGMLILPFYFVSIIVGVSSMFGGEASTNTLMYLVPIYNTINVLISILTFDVSSLHFTLMVVSNLVYVTVLVTMMAKMFQSEKIMFQR